ncbi:MAG: UDP-N-acetylglucosamine 4,6-dehydratase (inverting) [Deltaproteobacteria bacterium]|nr:MAG: UDP-N-acetylglucosamine 4,6-dehydratase (inverting) [Deltaproteobacteria bacterium]
MFNNANILITGGTGSFGRKFAQMVLDQYRPRRIIIFSRDEVKQLQMRNVFPDGYGRPMRYFIGDVRDRERLYRAFRGVDIVIHAAALKQVPTAEYNPLEVIKTNILGASNIIDAAIDCGVKKVVALSSDKAVSPANLYGATKLCADKLFVSAGVYTGPKDTCFSVVRYGNVIGSRGSIVPILIEKRAGGVVPITDVRMTRFWISLKQAVELVFSSIESMQGGEIFVPKIPSMRIVDLAKVVAPGCRHEIIGIRPGEKLHEVLLTEEDSRQALEFDNYYIITPPPFRSEWRSDHVENGRPVDSEFRYSSDRNAQWLTGEALKLMIAEEMDAP